MIIIWHLLPDNETRREVWPDDTPKWTLERAAWMRDALYWDTEADHVDPPACVADGERGVRGGRVVGES